MKEELYKWALLLTIIVLIMVFCHAATTLGKLKNIKIEHKISY